MIPAYNAAETIERALNSVYAQTYGNIAEVIVVDDGSTDDTAAVVRDRFPDAIVIQQPNAGAAAARNTGVSAATCEWIAFLDADDEWIPEKTAIQVCHARQFPGAALWGTGFIALTEDDDDERGTATVAGVTVAVTSFRDWWYGYTHANTCGWLFLRSVYSALGGFDERLVVLEDHDFLLRLTGAGYAVGVVGAALVRVHQTEGSLSRSLSGRVKLALTAPEVLSRWDPERAGSPQLLTREEFRRDMGQCYWHNGWILYGAGEHEAAKDYWRRAKLLSPGRIGCRLRYAICSLCPGGYLALSSLRSGSILRGRSRRNGGERT